MMPVERLPAASWQTAFGLGFISAVLLVWQWHADAPLRKAVVAIAARAAGFGIGDAGG